MGGEWGGWTEDDNDEEQENTRISDQRKAGGIRKVRRQKEREKGRERFSEGRGECEKPGCSISAPGSAPCYFSCAGVLASSLCSHAIITPSVWWHSTWAAFTTDNSKSPNSYFPLLTKI